MIIILPADDPMLLGQPTLPPSSTHRKRTPPPSSLPAWTIYKHCVSQGSLFDFWPLVLLLLLPLPVVVCYFPLGMPNNVNIFCVVRKLRGFISSAPFTSSSHAHRNTVDKGIQMKLLFHLPSATNPFWKATRKLVIFNIFCLSVGGFFTSSSLSYSIILSQFTR